VIRYINCFRKAPNLSTEDFREYWQSTEFNKLIGKIITLTGAMRCRKNLTLQVSMGEALLSERGLAQPYDGILEYYWESAQHLPEVYASDEARNLLEQFTRFQGQFVDLAGSTAFFTEHQD